MVNLTKIKSPIADFYAGKSVFIIGGTGFIGKIFDRIKKINPQTLNQLVSVSGDITENNFGISPEDEQLFLDKVSVVFHSAATVKFNERLDIDVSHNFEATKRLLHLSHRMKNLESLVFVSTAYISPQNQYLDEVAYPPPVGAKELQAFIDQGEMDNEEELTKFLHDLVPFTIITKDGMRKEIASFLLEKLPAMIADMWMKFQGKKPRYCFYPFILMAAMIILAL